MQKNDLQKKRPKMQIKKSAVAIAHPSFSVYNLGGRNVSFQNDPGRRPFSGAVLVIYNNQK